ncbi:MAG: FAD-dependent oxidoreductase [Acutalibacteraceae bacterium]|jgi:hypothetical protein
MDEVRICFVHSRRCYRAENRDLTRMYLEGREQANMLAKYIKENIPGFKHSFLTVTAPLLGVRKSRRVLGEYVLTAFDLASLAKHDDVICLSNHGYDIHNFEEPGNVKWAPVVNIKGQSVEHAEFDDGYRNGEFVAEKHVAAIQKDTLRFVK